VSSPTQRSLAECKARGWIAGVVEKWNPHAHIRQDLWGWVDIVALDPHTGDVLFIQTTSGAHHAHREGKVLSWEHLDALVKYPGRRALIWSWSQRVAFKKDGTKAKLPRWTLRETDLGSVVRSGDGPTPVDA